MAHVHVSVRAQTQQGSRHTRTIKSKQPRLIRAVSFESRFAVAFICHCARLRSIAADVCHPERANPFAAIGGSQEVNLTTPFTFCLFANIEMLAKLLHSSRRIEWS